MSRPRFKILLLFFQLFLLFFLFGCASLGLYNPATGRREFIMIPTDTEVSMGKNIHQQISSEYGLSNDEEKLARIKRVGQKIALISDRQDYQYHFYLINKDEINAFTTPGGNIYFFTGLLNKLTTDDEIAAVLAHEIGHCAARHATKKFQASLGYNLIGAIIFDQVGMEQGAKETIALASNVAVQLAMSAYSRQDEYEADRLGIKYMFLAGYNPDGMIKTLEVLQKESRGPQGPLILRSHPYLEDRIKAANLEIKEVPKKYGDS